MIHFEEREKLPCILIPAGDRFFRHAAHEFRRLYQEITRKRLRIVTRPARCGDMIVLGADSVNNFVHELLLSGELPPLGITAGSDEYRLLSKEHKDRQLLFIAGGRNRAVLYGIYHFFELAGCRYFWDGDRIPRKDHISLAGLDILEKPRFAYRGIRYFAHRSLKRFQPKHWDWKEWQQEISWCLKKRFNLFMLRTGYDDLFQKAFPESVPYPPLHSGRKDHTRSYTDLAPDWNLKYRAKLRKKILDYAFERDLMHPEDLGTMTHWYTPTPKAFIEKEKPDFLPQSVGTSQDIHLVWDIRQKKYLEYYCHLTRTHIRCYGKGELFHTIGLAERRCFADMHKNHEMKLFTYRRFIQELRQEYPHAPLLLASWDFAMHWTGEEIRQLLAEMDPENTIMLDYTAETGNLLHNFTTWGITGKFPWIFGIFHAYEANSDIRGNYDLIASRLETAAEDPFCKGLVFWPENSHSDTLMLEYAAANSWSPDPENRDIASFIRRFVRSRYSEAYQDAMNSLWKIFLEVLPMRSFVGPGEKHYFSYQELQFQPVKIFDRPVETILELEKSFIELHKERCRLFPEIFRLAAERFSCAPDCFSKRDIIDIARSSAGRLLLYALFLAAQKYHGFCSGEGDGKEILPLISCTGQIYGLLADLLESDPDYSLYVSLEEFRKDRPCNRELELSLKGNGENPYCRSWQFELVKYVYAGEFDLLASLIRKRIAGNERKAVNAETDLKEKIAAVVDRFYDTPLEQMAPESAEAELKVPETLRNLAAEAQLLAAML